jgi:hypothetical protein
MTNEEYVLWQDDVSKKGITKEFMNWINSKKFKK